MSSQLAGAAGSEPAAPRRAADPSSSALAGRSCAPRPLGREDRLDAELVCRHRAGSPHAREHLVRRLTPMVDRLTRRFGGHELADDLRQAAFLGLAKAIDRYDPRHGVPLRGYAVPTILGELRRFKRDFSWAVRPPRAMQELTLRVSACVDELTTRTGRQPTIGDVSAAIGADEQNVVEALVARRAYIASSLDAPLGEHDGESVTLGETLSTDDPSHGYQRVDDAMFVQALRGVLGDEERMILDLRFQKGWTQQEIGDHLGVSQMTVSRRQSIILERLRDHLATDPFLAGEPA